MTIADELQKLEALRANGSLNDDEYVLAKARVLSGEPGTPAPARVGGSALPNGKDNFLRRLKRSSRDRWLGGVCGGLGLYTPVPSWAWRLAFCLLLLGLGVGLMLYILLCILVPSDEDRASP
jgi:phage shock protein C